MSGRPFFQISTKHPEAHSRTIWSGHGGSRPLVRLTSSHCAPIPARLWPTLTSITYCRNMGNTAILSPLCRQSCAPRQPRLHCNLDSAALGFLGSFALPMLGKEERVECFTLFVLRPTRDQTLFRLDLRVACAKSLGTRPLKGLVSAQNYLSPRCSAVGSFFSLIDTNSTQHQPSNGQQ